MVTEDNEADLNGHFDVIFIPHPSEVSNLHEEEEFSYSYPSQFFKCIYILTCTCLISRITVMPNTVVLCGRSRTTCLPSGQNENLIFFSFFLVFKFFFKPFLFCILIFFKIYCRTIK